jgi:type VI secretion system protein ImpI
MPLHLSIENVTSLPDAGPLTYTLPEKRGGIEIGRDPYLDWVLPDPERVISGKHCEIRYRDGGYWLHDLSRNGTYVNHLALQGPYRLCNGDRIEIGHYVIGVEVDGESAGSPEAAAPEAGAGELWDALEAAPPIDPDELRPVSRSHPVLAADPLDWMVDLPTPVAASASAALPVQDAGNIWDSDEPVPEPSRGQQRVTLPPLDPSDDGRPSSRVPTAPPPPPVQSPAPAPDADPVAPRAAASPAFAGDFIRRFADGAGLQPSEIATGDPGELAETLGGLMYLCAGHLSQLLAGRARFKSVIRSSNHTQIEAQGNNPLRFAATPQEALAHMFGPPTPSYLDAAEALEQTFETLKKDQVDIAAAIQSALRRLLADFEPTAIEQSVEAPRNGLFSSERAYKARLWDEFSAQWKTRNAAFDGLGGAFMRFFQEAYDRQNE